MARIIIVWISLLFLISVHGQVRAQDEPANADSVVVPASTRYLPASFFKKLFTGRNYRRQWTVPVKMPVLHLEKTGLTILRMGGGMQTKSLRLIDQKGREWALRTVDKFAGGAVPPKFKNTFIENLLQEMFSAGHPYAALPVGALAEAVGVTSPEPVLYFVPDDEALGAFRNIFANTVCFLERREPVPSTRETGEVILEKTDSQDTRLMQKQILKARLLDMLVADWDRHEGQWLWAPKDSAGKEFYYPVPLDRDQAFFMSDGLLARSAKLLGMPYINNFKMASRKLRKLNYKSWEFDRFFLNTLDALEWKHTIENFQKALDDSVIDAAVRKLPPEVHAIGGKALASKLKSRRKTLLENAMKYYEFLSASVDVIGTNEDEVFKITGNSSAIVVAAYRYVDGKQGEKIYERQFLPGETREVLINGLKGDDRFLVNVSGDSGIKLKIYGDQGEDLYDIKGGANSRIYESKTETSLLMNTGSARLKFKN
jgi:hypothetical protein